MSEPLGRVFRHIDGQRGMIAVWQMRRMGVRRGQIAPVVERMRRVHRGVYANRDPEAFDELDRYLAAAFALGPGAAVSRLSALMLAGLRPCKPRDVDVTVPRGGGRAGPKGSSCTAAATSSAPAGRGSR